MSKSNHFFGQSVFGQLIDLLDPSVLSASERETQSDRYYKRFTTKDHLITMLFGVLAHCTSLREVCGGLMGLKGKLEHFGMRCLPRRSTLSYSNKNRSAEVFARIYYGLLRRYRSSLLDSLIPPVQGKRVAVIDSTTISLFKDILKCGGRNPVSGRRKGGIKVHTEMILDERVPKLIWMSQAATNDTQFLSKVEFNPDNVYAFDKGYIDYHFYKRLIGQHVGFVSRLKDSATFTCGEEFDIPADAPDSLLKDESIELPLRVNGKIVDVITLRRVVWWDDTHKRLFSFVTNLFEMTAQNVAAIYKQRWGIELLFKQLKQNFPLRYFLGENENAINIQIWCALIANLLLSVVKNQLTRKTAFSCIASQVRVNLINYIHLIKFLNEPEKDWTNAKLDEMQMPLFPT